MSMEDLVSCTGELDIGSNVFDLDDVELSEEEIRVKMNVKKIEGKHEEEEEEGEADDTSKLTKGSLKTRDQKKGTGRTTTVERSQTGRVSILIYAM
jgi:hypothetical protein